MTKNQDLIFKIASEDWEFEAIHKLNYSTFVKEIPQHSANNKEVLIDRLHNQNTYIICIQNNKLLGMLAIHDKRPFSLDNKLDNIDKYLPNFKSIFEIRLLAIEKKYRNSSIFKGILKKVFDIALKRGYDLGLISGTTRQLKLYKQLGFKPFANIVGSGDALYQPMYITLDNAVNFTEHSNIFKINKKPINYLPGPVSLVNGVLEAFTSNAISHREHKFIQDYKELEYNLCKKVNASKAYITTGSGTLANDIIASQLSLLDSKGLVLINGEFGRRLENQALSANLDFDTYSVADGETFDIEILTKKLNQNSNYTWLWLVHCETSTGVLNNISSIKNICNKNHIKLCLDCVSTIGACEVNLSSIYLASASSGKGIASLPGLAIIFANNPISSKNKLPKSFDLSSFEEKEGIPYTISSNAIYALIAALKNSDWEKRFKNVKHWSKEITASVEKLGLYILAENTCRASHVITIVLPKELSSLKIGEKMQKLGFLISYRSEYLLQKNLIQICLMGECIQPTNELVIALKQSIENNIQKNKLHKELIEV